MKFQDPGVQAHLDQMFAAVFNTYDLKDVVRYIEDKTYLRGARFSFQYHEFQKDILSDTSKTVYVQKCAQVGMSEAMARYALGVSRIIPYFSTILTMPFTNDVTKFIKTRLDPIIQESPDLARAVAKTLDNSENKGIGNSLLYARGTGGTTAALSVPADLLIHDEVDRSDPATIGQYQSRLQHSSWGLTRIFSTPTFAGVGIAAHMKVARRQHHMVKCHRCNHHFVPNYHEHVHIPGFNGDKQEITKYNIHTLRVDEAILLCPRCKLEPELWPQHREWVFENPNDRYDAVGYLVIPFSLPKICTAPYLVRQSVKYESWTEFCNQALGEVNNDQAQQLTENDVSNARWTNGTLDSTDLHGMGIDLGLTCHFTVGRITQGGDFLIVHRETCSLMDFRATKARLSIKYRVAVAVMDHQPYTDLVLDCQKTDKNLYGGIYDVGKDMQHYLRRTAEEEEKDGKLPMNVVRIARDLNFDELMGLFKAKKVHWMAVGSNEDALFQNHCLDMKRVQVVDRFGEMKYTWEKSSGGQDHFFHAVGYLYIACRLRETVTRTTALAGAPLMRVMKVTEQKPPANVISSSR